MSRITSFDMHALCITKNINNVTTKTTFKSSIHSEKIVTFYPNMMSKCWPSETLPTIGSFTWTFVDSNSHMCALLFSCKSHATIT